jgi:hypothetical protein
MGYFSNGGEGADYQHNWCNRCIHDRNHDCAVWLLHLLMNYEQNKNQSAANVLDVLIPRDGVGNKQCAMFALKTPATGQEEKK